MKQPTKPKTTDTAPKPVVAKSDRALLAKLAVQLKCANYVLSQRQAVAEAAMLLQEADRYIAGND